MQHCVSAASNQRHTTSLLIIARLTTYSDISSSYPNLKLPPDMKTEAAIEMWWNQEYDEKAGVFHQINWHRIILDGK